jgi:hypothetical protein
MTADAECKPCADLSIPDRLAQLDVTTPDLKSAVVCPGGKKGLEAGICPMHGLWVHHTDTKPPDLLACETAEACTDFVDTDAVDSLATVALCRQWFTTSGDQLNITMSTGAKCSNGTQGFMCLECKVGHSKVGGSCVECPGFDWGMLAFSLLGNLLMALFLLHKSTVTTISKLEIVHIWNKVDTNRSGQLGQDGVGQVLGLMGARLSDDTVAEKMKNVFGAETVASSVSNAEPCPNALPASVESESLPSPRKVKNAETQLVVKREKFVAAASQSTVRPAQLPPLVCVCNCD